MTSQVVQGMGILMGRYGHLKSKIMGFENTPLKNCGVFAPAKSLAEAARITYRTKLLVNSACKTASISLF